MERLTPRDPETRSADIVSENLGELQTLFPEAWTEERLDFEVLKQLLGGVVEEWEEKYGLNWHGKRQARQLALTPSTGTLRPAPDDSVDWDTTQNLMIEGDNLEVLKLLQKSYAGKVKLIYIDPPYNTGKDFVYPDNFQDSIKNYLELTRQVEGGAKISSNTETSGRFHTDWLNMIYPRLRVAKSLMAENGVTFISIDDVEAANLRLVCDDVYGAENFVAQLVWEGANKNDARQIGIVHEYVLVYARMRDCLEREWGLRKEGVDQVLAEVARLKELYGDNHQAASEDLAGWFRAMKAKPAFGLRRFRFVDARGVFKEDDPTAPGGRRFELQDPRNGNAIPLRRNRGWSFDQAEFERLVGEGRITFVTDRSIMVRRYLHETDTITPPSVFYQPARSASERLATLMGESVFDFPKDETVLAKFVEMATSVKDRDLVVDFFAGSGSTAHAVMAQNAADGGNRRYILVQLPEPLDPDNHDQAVAAEYCDNVGKPRNIAELTKERLRRASKKIKEENPLFAGDLGFRVFKLNSSNLRAWDPSTQDLDAGLLEAMDHLKPGRTQQDVLYELLLKLGLDLCVPIEQRQAGANGRHTVYSVGGGVLMACLSESIAREEVDGLAAAITSWHDELEPAGDTTCVFRDSAFGGDDVAKTNLSETLKQHGIKNVRSL